MKTIQDIGAIMKMELQATKQRRFLNNQEDYYVWYEETTAEHDGGFTIAATKPANPSCQNIAMRLRRDMTDEQNLYQFMQIAQRLPILSIR